MRMRECVSMPVKRMKHTVTNRDEQFDYVTHMIIYSQFDSNFNIISEDLFLIDVQHYNFTTLQFYVLRGAISQNI